MSSNLFCGDALELLQSMKDCSVDSLVTDPPAGIAFMNKKWDKDKGGMEAWVDWLSSILVECRRVLRPGGHGLVWALPRTSHWTGQAIEKAGFEIRDKVFHIFGSGFPKSHDVSKAIDKMKGRERKVVGIGDKQRASRSQPYGQGETQGEDRDQPLITAPSSPEAVQWDGWKTALKPAVEEWFLIRKPFKGSVASNVLEHGTGALNIEECR